MQALEVAQVGWDIGGAHVKVAALAARGRAVAALQGPCALWRGLEQLEGGVVAAGRTDFERLVRGELVYTGVVRTPLMALGDAIEFEGLRVALMAEHFATTADVYRLTGELDERCDQHASADGAEKTPPAS